MEKIEKSGLEEQGLVGFWSFDEIINNTIPDESENENNGILVGAAQGYGMSGLGVYFDGLDDSININDDPSLNFDDTNEFSISIAAVISATDFVSLDISRIFTCVCGIQVWR